MLTLLLKIGVVIGMVWFFLLWFERRNVYQPTRFLPLTGAALGVPWEEVRFSARDGVDLHGWFFPAPANAPFSNLVVVISHGNGGNISHRLSLYQLLITTGLNVFAYDYRGYGLSSGTPTEDGTYLDAEAAVDWLKSRGFEENRIIAHGESLGGGVAAELALRRPGLRGLILRSTFTSIPDLGAELFPYLPVRLVSRIRYDTRSKLPHISVPVLILHSREDSLIDFNHARSNYAAARQPAYLREIRGDHNDQPDASPDLYSGAIREFVLATRPLFKERR